MSLRIAELPATATATAPEPESGLGALSTPRGNLPLRGLDLAATVTGLTARTVVTQRFHNPHHEPVEATYIFPLPARAAVTDMTMTVAGRTVTAELRERGEARQQYDRAVREGKRAAIAEAERDEVFTMRVGNILPGEEATVALTVVGPLAYEDGEATLRFPLVVAPRYIPGTPLPGEQAGDGHAADTDAVPDASRITPPVLLPGFPNPVALSITVDIAAEGLPLPAARSSLHTVVVDETAERVRVRVEPGERVDRDFVLRLAYGDDDAVSRSLACHDDPDGDEGTFQLTVLPPRVDPTARPRDVVVLLDRSGSMGGWKMVAARRAAARIVDTLGPSDHFAVRCFDTRISAPDGLGDGLVPGTDRNRFAAVEHLARTDARGGTVLLTPLVEAADLLGRAESGRDRVIVLVTDGQVGNEDQIIAELSGRLNGTRVHVVGIDRAVNGGFLHRLALVGRGRCELVESQDRLDEAAAHIHRRIVAPVVTDVTVTAGSGHLVPESFAPGRVPDLFTGVPLLLWGRYRRSEGPPRLTVAGTDADGRPWSAEVVPRTVSDDAVAASWARAHLQDLQDRYAAAPRGTDLSAVEKAIVSTSLRHRVLSRFTAFVAVDTEVVTEGGKPRTVVQPVELPDGWEAPPPPSAPGMTMAAAPVAPGASPFGAGYGGPAPTAAPSGPPSFLPAPSGPPPSGPVAAGARSAAPMGRPAVVNRRSRASRHGGTPVPTVRYAGTLAEELAVLTGTASGTSPADTDRERRTRLADLATRLAAVLPGIENSTEFPPETRRQLAALVTELAACDAPRPPAGEALTELWDRTVRLLTELSRATGEAAPMPESPAPPSDEDGSAGGGVRAFWKRRR